MGFQYLWIFYFQRSGHYRPFEIIYCFKNIEINKNIVLSFKFFKKGVPESNIDVNIIVQIKMMNVPVDIPIIYCRRGKLRIKQKQRTKVVKLNFSLHFYFRVFFWRYDLSWNTIFNCIPLSWSFPCRSRSLPVCSNSFPVCTCLLRHVPGGSVLTL